MLGITKKIYNGVTTERFTRIYIMAAITFFGFGILDKPMTTSGDLNRRSLYQIEKELRGIGGELSEMSKDLGLIKKFGLKTLPR